FILIFTCPPYLVGVLGFTGLRLDGLGNGRTSVPPLPSTVRGMCRRTTVVRRVGIGRGACRGHAGGLRGGPAHVGVRPCLAGGGALGRRRSRSAGDHFGRPGTRPGNSTPRRQLAPRKVRCCRG